MEKKLFTKKNSEIIYNLVSTYHNDYDLGKKVREFFGDNTYVKSIHNDADLGRTIRKNFQNFKK